MNVNGMTTNFTYADWGRILGKTQGSYAATYGYRFGDKLKAVTSSFPGEAPSVGYNYDGLGKCRVEQLGTSTITWFRWLGWEESSEDTGTPGRWTIGAMQTGYVPGLATFAGSNPTTAEWRYPLTDHLGSVRQLSAQNKAALARYDYAPYGELMRSAGLPLTVGYTGHRWDPAIGQYFAPFRYYNPQTARWNMRDPLDFVDGPNMYAYVAGRPTVALDPEGGSMMIIVLGNAALAGIISAMCPGNTWTDVWTDFVGGGVGGAFSLLPIPQSMSNRILQGILGGFAGGHATLAYRARLKPLARERHNPLGDLANTGLGMAIGGVFARIRALNPIAGSLSATAITGSLSCALQNIGRYL